MEKDIRNGHTCQYCNTTTKLKHSYRLLQNINIDEHKLSLYCPNCIDTYVGCHNGAQESLGMVANMYHRDIRMRCHKIFDFIWFNFSYLEKQDRNQSRKYAYLWLNEFFNFDILLDYNHIGKLYYEECLRLLKFLHQDDSVEEIYFFIKSKFSNLPKSSTYKDKTTIVYEDDFLYNRQAYQ